MGAWGSGPFDNDDAADFISGIAKTTNPGVVAAVMGDAMLAATASDGYIEAPEMSRAVAAASVVASLRSPTLPMPSALNESWLTALGLVPSDRLVREAASVFVRAFDTNDNEWYDLWADAELVDEVRDQLGPYASAVT